LENGEQIFINYDQGSDDYMLINYGFVLPKTENRFTALEITWEELLKAFSFLIDRGKFSKFARTIKGVNLCSAPEKICKFMNAIYLKV
jgi:hypothetical protein